MFADNLIILRKRAGLTQEALGEALGVSRQAVSKYENGSAEPEFAKLAQLTKLLNVDYNALLGDPTAGTTDGQSAAHPIAPGHLMIRSLVNGKLVRVFGFSLATNLSFRKNAGKVTLIGETDQHDFFNTGQVELGRYATRAQAEREVTMIEAAMAAGEGTYRLQFALAPKEK